MKARKSDFVESSGVGLARREILRRDFAQGSVLVNEPGFPTASCTLAATVAAADDGPRGVRKGPMTLIAFAADDGRTYVFAGTDRHAILRDTRDGKRFGFAALRRRTELAAEEVERMAFPFYQNALGAVARARRDHRSLSYFVGAALKLS
jgi:hypothetical protein